MPNKLPLVLTAALIVTALSTSAQAQIKALLLTSPGVYHDYAFQTNAITSALARSINIRFDVSLQELERWKQTDFAQDYDLLLYNICNADNTDAALIANLRRQTEELGTPAIVIHCTMHSFRKTDDWWPLYGLKTVHHEAIGEMPQQHASKHPILNGIPADWVVAHDELYSNITFDGQALLTSVGEEGADHVTAWVRDANGTRVFGTTLGHSTETINDPVYQRLLVNGVLWATGHLTTSGEPTKELAPNSQATAIGTVSKAEGVDYLPEEARDCVFRQIAISALPCYAGCTLHPLKWGEQARECKYACAAAIPPAETFFDQCLDG